MKKDPLTRRAGWLLLSAGSTLLATALLDRALQTGWRAATRREPPRNPGKEASWGQALAWTAGTAAAAAVLELLVREGAERGWKSLTGHRPPKGWL